MKSKKSIFVCVFTSVIVLSTSLAASAEGMVDMKGLKNSLLLDIPAGYNINNYNTNNDNSVNVLDLCRAKQDFIFNSNDIKQNIILKCCQPEINKNKSIITIPVSISGNKKGVSALQFKVEYDKRYFTLSDAYGFDLGGSAVFSDNSGIVQYISDNNENITSEGNIVYLEFTTSDNIPYSSYDFKLTSIQASYNDSFSGNTYIPSDEYNNSTDAVKITLFKEAVTQEVTTVTTVTTTVNTVPSRTETQPPQISDKLIFSLQDAEIVSNGNRLRIPVYMQNNTFVSGLDMLTMNLEYDSEMFNIAGVSGGEFGGYGYSAGNNNVVFMSQNAQNITDNKGIIAYIELDIRNKDKSGVYSFSLKEIKASYSENWNQKPLSEDKYMTYTDVYKYKYKGADITTVTTPVSTTVTTTTTPVSTTVTTTTTPVSTTVTTTTTPVSTTVTTTTTPVNTTVTTTTTPVSTTVTTTTTPVSTTVTTTTTSDDGSFKLGKVEQEVINKINQYRASKSLTQTKVNEGLCKAACIRAEELSVEFSQRRPNGQSDLQLFSECGVNILSYNMTATAISTSADQVFNDIMDLKTSSFDTFSFNKIGIGHYYSASSAYKDYWVIFIGM